ncbi:uncharacterized protein LOC124160885 [Ischnura elegans]|uniref:uncharacterized protein LOC124160885 n=1 Tax=Ischnura elegans TaxID=197161 RepID=UPI001ED867D9|nr:uncharacterized protein LOC124160885 [Ischnura elegans]
MTADKGEESASAKMNGQYPHKQLKLIFLLTFPIITEYPKWLIQRILRIKKKLYYVIRLLVFQAMIFYDFFTGNDGDVRLVTKRTSFKLEAKLNDDVPFVKYRRLNVTEYILILSEKGTRRQDSDFSHPVKHKKPENVMNYSKTRSGLIYNRQ